MNNSKNRTGHHIVIEIEEFQLRGRAGDVLSDDFRNQLRKALESRGLTMTRWAQGGSPDLAELSTSPKRTVLYHKSFSGRSRYKNLNTGLPGFWGLRRNQLTRLESADVRWFAVLLLRSPTAGYLLTSAEVISRIDDGSFRLNKDGDYKISESHLDVVKQRFQSLQDLLDRIL